MPFVNMCRIEERHLSLFEKHAILLSTGKKRIYVISFDGKWKKHMTIGETIRNIRKSIGMTQLELATAIGADPGTIRKYESGRRNPKPATLEKIAQGLGIEPSLLTEGDLNTPRAMQRLFGIYNAYDGVIKTGSEIKKELDTKNGDADSIYVSFPGLEKFLYSWYCEYRKLQDALEKTNDMKNSKEMQEYREKMQDAFRLWMLRYPETEPDQKALKKCAGMQEHTGLVSSCLKKL